MTDEELIKLVQIGILADVNCIIEKISRGNDNGTSQYTCELIKKKISEELVGKKYSITYRKVPNHSHDE